MLIKFRVSYTKKESSSFGIYQNNRPNYNTTGYLRSQINQKAKNVRIVECVAVKKKPIRVVLKAPFHYKVGKHRVTTRAYLKTIHIQLPNPVNMGRLTPQKIVRALSRRLEYLPTLSGPLTSQKTKKLSTSFVLDKNIFTLR